MRMMSTRGLTLRTGSLMLVALYAGCVGDVTVINIETSGGMMSGSMAGSTSTGGQVIAGVTAGVNAGVSAGAEPPMGAIMPPLGGAEACTPGQKIDTCTVCGPDTRYIMPTNDPECEPVDCSELNRFFTEVGEDGAETCMEEVGERVGGTCYRMGYCHTTSNTACMLGETVSYGTIYPGCGRITGCDSTSSPSISQTPQDGLCHGFGRCEAMGGPCDVPATCAGFENAAGGQQQTFCDANEMACKVGVSASNIQSLSEISCLTYCASASKTCTRAWSSNGGCNEGSQIDCNVAQGQVICECS
jgi:hypothetical protein